MGKKNGRAKGKKQKNNARPVAPKHQPAPAPSATAAAPAAAPDKFGQPHHGHDERTLSSRAKGQRVRVVSGEHAGKDGLVRSIDGFKVHVALFVSPAELARKLTAFDDAELVDAGGT